MTEKEKADELMVAADLCEEHGFRFTSEFLRKFHHKTFFVLQENAVEFFRKTGTRCRKAMIRLEKELGEPISVHDLVNRITAHRLLCLRNFGKLTLYTVRRKLADHGLKLADD